MAVDISCYFVFEVFGYKPELLKKISLFMGVMER